MSHQTWQTPQSTSARWANGPALEAGISQDETEWMEETLDTDNDGARTRSQDNEGSLKGVFSNMMTSAMSSFLKWVAGDSQSDLPKHEEIS